MILSTLIALRVGIVMLGVGFFEVIPDVSKFITDPPTALLIIVILGGVLALGKGLVVPRPIYDREVKRADKSDSTATMTIEALSKLTTTVDDLHKTVDSLDVKVKDLTMELLRK